MSRGGNRKTKRRRTGRQKQYPEVIGDRSDPDGFAAHLTRFFEHCRLRGYTEATLHTWSANLRWFTQWCEERGLTRPDEITYPILSRYQKTLYYYRQRNGEPLSVYSQNARLSSVKSFFKWLTRERYLPWNPASELQLTKSRRRLPKAILTVADVEKILHLVDINDPFGLRDRAILETLYSTGMRRAELTRLNIYDVDHSGGVVLIEQGKGMKDRWVPIGERALLWIKRYQQSVRPDLVVGEDDHTLFLNQYGEPLSLEGLSRRVKGYIDQAGINKTGSCHLLRHAMATHLLDNGADVRYIQEMLGHAKLDTTQLYTHVSIMRLKEVHRAMHPAKLEDKENLLAALAEEEDD